MPYQIENNRIFKLNEQNEVTAELRFIKMSNDSVNINFVYVNPNYRGQGLAGDLMNYAYNYFKKNNYQISASCPYAKKWLEKENV